MYFSDKRNIIELLKASILAGFLNILGYLFFLLLVGYGVEPKITVTILYPIMVIISYFLYGKSVFNVGLSLGSLLKFTVAHLSGYLLNITLLFIFIDVYGVRHEISQLVSMVLIAIYLFVIFKFLIFVKN